MTRGDGKEADGLHELGILMSVIKTVEDYAAEHQVGRIEKLVLQIGEISSVIPEYMRKVYPAAAEGTLLADARPGDRDPARERGVPGLRERFSRHGDRRRLPGLRQQEHAPDQRAGFFDQGDRMQRVKGKKKRRGLRAVRLRILRDLKKYRLAVPAFSGLCRRLATVFLGTICPLSALTGLPCPGCGSTRALLSGPDGPVGRRLFLQSLYVYLWLLLAAYAGWQTLCAAGKGRRGRFLRRRGSRRSCSWSTCTGWRRNFPAARPWTTGKENVLARLLPAYGGLDAQAVFIERADGWIRKGLSGTICFPAAPSAASSGVGVLSCPSAGSAAGQDEAGPRDGEGRSRRLPHARRRPGVMQRFIM